MSKRVNLRFALGIFLIGIFSVPSSSRAVNYYWDTTAGAGNGTGGTGTYTATTNLWSTNALGDATLTANAGNSTNDVSYFQGTAGTVTLGASILQNSFIIGTNGYTITTSTNTTRSLTSSTITLGNNVNLNLSSFSTGTLGFESNSITGGTGSSITLSAPTGSGKRVVRFNSGVNVNSSVPIIFSVGGNLPAGDYLALGNSTGTAIVNSTITGNSGTNDMTFFSSGSSLQLNGSISGSQGVAIAGNGLATSGPVYLSASNSYVGKTTLYGGSVYVSNNSSFSTNSIVVASNAIIRGIGFYTTNQIANAIELASGANLSIGSDATTNSISFNGIISGSGSVAGGAKSGGYSAYLMNTNNTFTGGVSVTNYNTLYVANLGNKADTKSAIGTGATITLGNASNPGTLRWLGSAGNEISDKDFVVAGVTGTNTVFNAFLADGPTNATLTLSGVFTSTVAGDKKITFAGYKTNTLTISGLITEFPGSTNSVNIGGNSTGIIILGNANNSFSGPITFIQTTGSQYTTLQTASIGNSNFVSPLGKNGTINFAGVSSSAYSILKYTGTGETSDKVINLSAANAAPTLDQSGTGNLKFTSAITATVTGAKLITLQGSTAGTGELGGDISDLGNVVNLIKSGTGTWKLSGSNSYSGTTELKLAGVLQVGSTNSLSRNTSLLGASSSAATATLDLSAIGGGNYIANSFGTALTGGFNMNFTNSSGSAAALTFTNAENYLTIASNNSAGRCLNNQSSLLDVKFNGNIEIGSTTLVDKAIEFAGPGSFRVEGAVKNSGTAVRGLQKTGAGTLTLAGTNNYNGTTYVEGGTLEVGASGALPTASVITISNGATLRFLKSSGGISVGSLTNAGTLEQNLVTTITSSGAVNLTGSAIKVNGNPSLASYTLVTGTSLTGTPTLSSSIPNYKLSNSATSLLLVQKQTPVVVVTPGSYTYTGSTQGPSTAQVSTGGSTSTPSLSYSGTTSSGSTYGPSSTPPTAPGSYTVTATTAEDPNYLAGTSSATVFTISKATPSITVAPTASDITYGQTLADSNLTGGTASTAGSYAFTTPSTSPNVGTASQGVTFTPNDTANYSTATTSVSVTVGKATPTISAAPAASDITFGQTLADSNLTGGTASTPGSFAFTTPSTSPNVGTASQGVTFTPNDTANYSTATTSVSVTVTASAPTGLSYNSPSINATVGTAIANLTPAVTGSGITYSIDPALPLDLSLNPTTGVISGTPSVTSASAIYTVTARNVGGSTTTALTIVVGYAVGPVAVDDALTKAANNEPFLIPVSDLLANDYRITNASGATSTTGLSVTAVTSGSGNTATLAGPFVQFTPANGSTDTFTYTVSDGTNTATGTVTITKETEAPVFDLQIVKVGTAELLGGSTTVTHDFIGVPNQTYLVEYATDLVGAWTSAGNQSTGVTGSFSVSITKSGDFVSQWNAHMFFRARLVR